MDAAIRDFYIATGMEAVAVYWVPNPGSTPDDPPWRLVLYRHSESAPPAPAAAGVREGMFITEFLQRFEDGVEIEAGEADNAILLVGWIPDGSGLAWSPADPLPLPGCDPTLAVDLGVDVGEYWLHLRTGPGVRPFSLPFGEENCILRALSNLLDRAQRQSGAHVWLDDLDGGVGFVHLWDRPGGEVRLRAAWPQRGENEVLDITMDKSRLISSLRSAIAAMPP